MDTGSGIFLVVIVSAWAALLPLVWPTMPHYVAVVLWLVLSALIIAFIFWRRFFSRQLVTTVPTANSDTDSYYENIISIKGKEPDNYPEWSGRFFGILCLLSLSVMGLIVAKTPVHFNLEWIGFFLLVGVLPLGIAVDILIFEPKQNRLGRSRVAVRKPITLLGDIETVFNKCLKVLDMMNTTRIIVDRLKLIKVCQRQFIRGNHVIILKLSHIKSEEAKTKIEIIGDSQWTTVRWDFLHTNRKNVDTFERLIISEVGNIEGVVDKPASSTQ